MMFSEFLTISPSLIAYLELSITFVHMNIVRQRIRNDFRQSLVSKDTRKATRRSQPYKQRRFWGLSWCVGERGNSHCSFFV